LRLHVAAVLHCAPQVPIGPSGLFENHDFLEQLAALVQVVEITPKQEFKLLAPVVTEGFQRLLGQIGLQRILARINSA
jgi:hypothetical protein